MITLGTKLIIVYIRRLLRSLSKFKIIFWRLIVNDIVLVANQKIYMHIVFHFIFPQELGKGQSVGVVRLCC